MNNTQQLYIPADIWEGWGRYFFFIETVAAVWSHAKFTLHIGLKRKLTKKYNSGFLFQILAVNNDWYMISVSDWL